MEILLYPPIRFSTYNTCMVSKYDPGIFDSGWAGGNIADVRYVCSKAILGRAGQIVSA